MVRVDFGVGLCWILHWFGLWIVGLVVPVRVVSTVCDCSFSESVSGLTVTVLRIQAMIVDHRV